MGKFFTPLFIERAFVYQDELRAISSRRFVAPSFNDIRLVLNTAQIMSLAALPQPVRLVTFDGDITLYDDGQSLHPSNPVIARILGLMKRGLYVGIVTAAGYTDASRYRERLYGLLEAVRDAAELEDAQRTNLIVMGGESSFMFRACMEAPDLLVGPLGRNEWQLPEMLEWEEADVQQLLDIAQQSLEDSVSTMRMDASMVRKERAVGIIHAKGGKFPREQLEEVVLAAQKKLELSDVGRRLPFCAFNGGNDVFVDIGDKRLGVLCCQHFFGNVAGGQTLHIGDQFLSAGHNE